MKIILESKLLTSLFIIPCSIFVIQHSSAQTPGWVWAKSAGGTLLDGAWSVAVDASGSTFVAGNFESSSITFGSTTLNNSATDTNDIFLVKYDAGGNVLWANSAGGINSDEAASVAVDSSGNFLVTGTFSSASITFGSTILTNTGSYGDMFIVKYDAGGNVLWAKNAGGIYDDKAASVAADASGNILVSGYFQSSPVIFGSDTLTNAGNYDMFLVKYDASGNELWANSVGGSNDDRGYAVTADASGNVLVAGAFLSSSITIGSATLSYAGGAYSDIFLAKYDSGGNALWAKSAGGTYLDEPNSVTTDVSGNVYLAGIVYSSSIIFGSDTLTNSGSSFYCEMFIVKYDANGNPQWAHNAGASTNNDIAYSVDADVSGNIYLAGVYGNPITFGSITLTGGGIFIVKYDGGGTALWAIGVPGGIANSVTVHPSGDIYAAGSIFNPSITFGSTTLTNMGVYDMFLAKLSASTGIESMMHKNDILLFPNPATNQFTIYHSQFVIHEIVIYDLLGQKVFSGMSEAGSLEQTTINVSKFPEGVYIVQIQAEDFMETKKLIIAK